MRKYLSNPDLHGVVIVTAGTYIASFFSYLLQFFLGRLLSVEDYGLFNTYLAISYILGVPAYVLSTSVVKYVADLSGKKEFDQLSYIYKKFQSFATFFGLGITFLLIIFKVHVENYLKIESTPTTILYAFVLGFSYFFIVPLAYLQGFLRYRSYSLSNVLGSFFRFLLPITFLYLGWGLTGVFAGLLMTSFITYAISRNLLNRNLYPTNKFSLAADYKKLLAYSLPLFFINLGLILLNNVDLIIVKRLFSASEAGYYAGTVTLGKILLFGASTISAVMFPKVANEYSQNKSLKKIFTQFFLLQLFVVSVGTILFSSVPAILTNLFFGDKFLGSVQYLPGFSIFIGLYVLINFLILFLMAIDKTYISLVLMITVVIQYIWLNTATSVSGIINTNVKISASLLFILLTVTLTEMLKKPSPKSQ